MLLQAPKRPSVLAGFSILIFSLWGIMAFFAVPQFQNSAWDDSLAMVNVLFPQFLIILLLFVGICLLVFRQYDSPTWLHMLLVGQFAVILYFTPFLLSGFSWNPDTLWHAGVAEYIPDVLSGSNFVLTQYAQAYPFSFVVSYFAENVLGLGVHLYTLYIYPLICMIGISELAYVFASRVFNPKIAFLTMLLALPALHYFEPHVSPFSFGTLLVLSSLILLTIESRKSLFLSFVLIILLTVTHPISPVSLGIYLFAAMLVGIFFRRAAKAGDYVPQTSLFSQFLFLGVLWFSWTFFYAIPKYLGVQIAIQNFFNLNFLSKLFYVSAFTGGAESFIFPGIHQLGLAIYAAIFLLFLAPSIWNSILFLRRHKKPKLTTTAYKRLTLSLAAILYAVMGYLLFLSSGERFLLGRGLLFFIFMGSMVIATYLIGLGKTRSSTKTFFAFGLVAFLACTFPLVAYSKEAYNTFTPSAGEGLSFLSSNVNLPEETLSMGYDQQLASYANLSQGLYLSGFPATTEWSAPLDGWTLSSNSAPYALNSDAAELSLSLNAVDSNSYVSISTERSPKLKLPRNTYLKVNITASENAQVSFIFSYFEATEPETISEFSVDHDVNATGVERFNFDPIAGGSLSGLVRLELSSSDGLPSTVDVFEIDFEAPPSDVVVLRVNSYFFFAMRYDLSFEQNRYTALEERLSDVRYSSALNAPILYNKIYSNEKFEIYVRSP
jgi:hypothetical protein